MQNQTHETSFLFFMVKILSKEHCVLHVPAQDQCVSLGTSLLLEFLYHYLRVFDPLLVSDPSSCGGGYIEDTK